MNQDGAASRAAPPLWQAVLFAALAGGLAWGIRGQYGHETGAMLAGLLVGLVLTLLFCPLADTLAAARAVALATVAMGFGGSETYGQTVGLTKDPDLVGNVPALAWGMLGLAIKGGVWIGFGGAFLGMGLGGIRYRPREMYLILVGLLGLFVLGNWLLNEPFDPAHRELPRVYFSADWRWLPDKDLTPRREVWGGLALALAGLLVYTHLRRDPLAPRLGLWGILGGALGFPLGESLQAYHAWNHTAFQAGPWATLDPLINWWNFMETTFGAVMGAVLGLGLWLHRRRIALLEPPTEVSLLLVGEVVLLAVHLPLLLATEFGVVPRLTQVYAYGLVLGLIPLVAVSGGRWWPYLVVLPLTVIPIAGKTLRQLAYREHSINVVAGWLLYVAVPLAVTAALAWYFGRPGRGGRPARPFLRATLLLTTWLYFGLNYAFFHFPWPWAAWTQRTPNAIVFTVYALGLTFLAVRPAGPSTARPG